MWIEQDREKLGEVVPLDSPLSITFAPSTICNFKCKHCIQSTPMESIKRELMLYVTFIQCIDQLKEFPSVPKKIEFIGVGEPLINEMLCTMISHAKRLGSKTSVITNGSLLNGYHGMKFSVYGLDEIKISIYGLSSKEYLENTGAKVNFTDMVDQIGLLHSYGKTKVYVKAFSNINKKKFFKIFSMISDGVSIENIIPIFKGINIETGSRFGDYSHHICTYPFYKLLIMPDGRVTSCCDPTNSIYYGNIHDTTLKEMWNSPKRRSLMLSLLNGYEHKNCQNCFVPYDINCPEDYLELYKEEILKRI